MPTSFEHYRNKASKLGHYELVYGAYMFFDDRWIERWLINNYCLECPENYVQAEDGFCDCDHWIYDSDCRASWRVRDFFERVWAFEEMIRREF